MDISKNTFFKFEAPDGHLYNLTTFKYQTHNEESQIIFDIADLKHHALHSGNYFICLINKDICKHIYMVNWHNEPYPLFGFRIDKNQMLF